MTTIEAYADELLPGPAAGGTRGRDFMAGVLCAVAFAGLLPMLGLNPYPASSVIGIVSVLVVYAALYVKYRGRIILNHEVALVLGVVLQYLLAPVLVRILTSDFTQLGGHQHGERYAVKDVYGQAMLIVLLFVATYFFVSAAFPVRTASRRRDGRLELAYSQRTLLVMAAMAVMLWMTRAALLATGSFYHIHRSRFSLEDSRYSGWAQFDSGVGPMILSFAWGALFVRKLNIWVVLAYTLVEFAWNFSSGGRERTLTAFIVIALTYVIYRNRIPWRVLGLSIIPVAFLIGFMDYYRYAIQRTTDVNDIRVSGIVDALSVAQRESSNFGIQSTLYRGLMRFNDVESVAAIYRWTGSSQPFLEGETYGRIPIALVPRALWPEKPVTTTPINEWFFTHEGGSSPTTVMGEGYLNYGWPGVVLAGVVVAVLVRIVDWFMMRPLWNVAVLPVYIGSLAIVARLHTQPISIWIPTVIKMLFLTWIIHMLTRPPRPAPGGPAWPDASSPYGTREDAHQPAYY
jgi:hypothetical protein